MTDADPQSARRSLRFVDKEGNPLTVEEWAVMFANVEDRRLHWHAWVKGGEQCTLVTMFFGHVSELDGLLPLCGTALRTGEQEPFQEMETYQTIEEADAGHRRWLHRLEAV